MLIRRTGPLTADLRREPAGFGLGQVPAKSKPTATADLICGYCSTGCSLTVHLRGDRAVNITPSAAYPVNRGVACPKGWEALTVLDASDRATMPLVRDASGAPRPVTWDAALDTMVDRFRAIQTAHGPEAIAFLSTGQMPTEEMALLGALAKFGMGMRHGDGNTRQCMATSVVAYKQAFGFDAPPYTYRDFEESDVIVLVGANLCIAHPILWERVLRNPHHPEIVVVDPRMTETAMAATQHLPLRPKSDQVLFYGLARWLIAHGAIDRAFIDAHTAGHPDGEQLAVPPDHRGDPARRDQGPLGHRHQPGALLDQPAPGAGHPWPPRHAGGAGHVRVDGYGTDGGHRPAGCGLGRKGGHVHQLGTPHRHDCPRGAATWPRPPRLRDLQARRPPLGLRRDVPPVGITGGDVPHPAGVERRPAVRHHRHRRLRDAEGLGRHPMALPVRGLRRSAGGRGGAWPAGRGHQWSQRRTPPLRRWPVLPSGRPRAVAVRSAASVARGADRAVSTESS